VPQVDDERRCQNERHARMAGDEPERDELRRAGEHGERHQLSVPEMKRARGDERAEDHAEGRRADHHRDGVASAVGEFAQGGARVQENLLLCAAKRTSIVRSL
jgi:hypothetical protein